MTILDYFKGTPFIPKLVCGAGNEDEYEVERLVRFYHGCGFRYFDISAKDAIVEAAMRGLDGKEGYLNVSMGIAGDPHADKARINSDCIVCGECKRVCPNNAANPPVIDKMRCVGCGRCVEACPVNAISKYTTARDVKAVIPALVGKYPIASCELHMVGNLEVGARQWVEMQASFPGMLSLCIDRSIVGDRDLIDKIKWCMKGRDPYTTVIQADGCPMSGDENAGTTLQALAIAQIVDRANLPAYLMVSGGTNQYTRKYLASFGIKYKGIAYGTYARKLVRGVDGGRAKVLVAKMMEEK